MSVVSDAIIHLTEKEARLKRLIEAQTVLISEYAYEMERSSYDDSEVPAGIVEAEDAIIKAEAYLDELEEKTWTG